VAQPRPRQERWRGGRGGALADRERRERARCDVDDRPVLDRPGDAQVRVAGAVEPREVAPDVAGVNRSTLPRGPMMR